MASGDDGSTGERLARVTYLPGVVAPPSPEAELPEFETFFGTAKGADTVGHNSGTADTAAAAADSEVADSEVADCEVTAKATKRREIRAENVSMHALARRGMSRWELEKTLLARELDEDIVIAELDRLEGVGLLDDAALAETFVRTQHERKGLGRGAITAELRRRHIDQHHVEAALEQVDDDDEQVRVTELAVKRAGQLSSYDHETAKRRLNGFLMRKGYSSSVVRAAVDEALGSRSSGSSGVRFR